MYSATLTLSSSATCLAQIVVTKAVNQMVEQRERQKQCRHARLSELQARILEGQATC
jgi:hypothetical protein